MATKNDVAAIAGAVTAAHSRGQKWVTIRGKTFDTKTTNLCARFVRIAYEAAMGIEAFNWPYAAPNARTMEEKLKANNKRVQVPGPGDIVAMNNSSKYTNPAGHIGIFLGNGFIAQNTSSTVWGPGTVKTELHRVASIISGYYSTLPAAAQIEDARYPRIVLEPGGVIVRCNAELVDGVTRCDLRALAEAVGLEVHGEHLDERNAIYLKP